MLRSNGKKARENVRSYIMQDADYLEERAQSEGKTLEGVDGYLAFAWEIFRDEMRGYIEKNYSCADFGIFLSWARGLAMGGLFCYYYNRSAVTDLGDILEETESERSRYSEQEAEEMLTRLIYREMQEAYGREWLRKHSK